MRKDERSSLKTEQYSRYLRIKNLCRYAPTMLKTSCVNALADITLLGLPTPRIEHIVCARHKLYAVATLKENPTTCTP